MNFLTMSNLFFIHTNANGEFHYKCHYYVVVLVKKKKIVFSVDFAQPTDRTYALCNISKFSNTTTSPKSPLKNNSTRTRIHTYSYCTVKSILNYQEQGAINV